MLDGPSHQSLVSWVTQAIPTITSILINYNNLSLQEEAAAALERTAEIIPQVYFQDPLFTDIYPRITSIIEAHPRVF